MAKAQLKSKTKTARTFNELVPVNSKYLGKDDVDDGITVTIEGFATEIVKGDKGDEEKGVVYFSDCDKPLILNRTNADAISGICGSDALDDAIGHKITLYNDRAVSFGGRATGGIRVRQPQSAGRKLASKVTVRKVKR